MLELRHVSIFSFALGFMFTKFARDSWYLVCRTGRATMISLDLDGRPSYRATDSEDDGRHGGMAQAEADVTFTRYEMVKTTPFRFCYVSKLGKTRHQTADPVDIQRLGCRTQVMAAVRYSGKHFIPLQVRKDRLTPGCTISRLPH
jgi:hypothetical protein